MSTLDVAYPHPSHVTGSATGVRATSRANRLLTIVFCLLITLPGLKMIFAGRATESPGENRRLAKMPSLRGLWPYPRQWFRQGFKTFVEDQFGFRSDLIGLNSNLLYHGLGISPSTRVYCGRGQWLYYRGYSKEDNEVEWNRDKELFTEEQLTKIRQTLCKSRDWARSRGARFLFVVAPNKATIYPEHLPPLDLLTDRRTRLDQVFDDLRSHTDIAFIDLRPALLAAKASGQLYYKYDTHWNGKAAAIASVKIVDHLRTWFPSLAPLSHEDFRIRTKPDWVGDLARMLGTIPPLKEERIELMPQALEGATFIANPFPHPADHSNSTDALITTENSAPGQPTAIVLRDSFLEAVLPVLSERLSRATYVRSYHIPAAANEIRPDVVVLEIVERNLYALTNEKDANWPGEVKDDHQPHSD
jgi:alginate O-acetyltransferase complex protein AlgJ